MKNAFFLILCIVFFNAGFQSARGQTFTVTYTCTDGSNGITSSNWFDILWDAAPDSIVWTWSVFGFQGNWYYCNSSGTEFGMLTPDIDDGTTLSFSLAQFGGALPNAITTGNAMNLVIFTNIGPPINVDLNLDGNGNLSSNAVTAGITNTSVTLTMVLKVDNSQPPPNTTQEAPVLTGELLGNGDMRLTCGGITGTNYVLEKTFSLTVPVWNSLVTNTADSNGFVTFTDSPARAIPNFWRVRVLP